MHELNYRVKGVMGRIGAFVVVALLGEFARGDTKGDFASFDAVGSEEHDAIELGGFTPAVDAVANE